MTTRTIHPFATLLLCSTLVGCLETRSEQEQQEQQGPREVICVYEQMHSEVSPNFENRFGRWVENCSEMSCHFVEDQLDCFSMSGYSDCSSDYVRNRVEYYGTCEDYHNGIQLSRADEEYPNSRDAPVAKWFAGHVDEAHGQASGMEDITCQIRMAPISTYNTYDGNCAVVIECGGVTVYYDQKNECTMDRNGFDQVVQVEDNTYEDGTWLLSLDTGLGEATITGEVEQGPFSYTIVFDSDWFYPTEVSEFALTGRVTQTSGATPTRADAACRVSVTEADTESFLNCHVQVECDGVSLYGHGSGGFNICLSSMSEESMVIEDRLTTPSDGDPAVFLDLEAGEVTIREATETQGWSAVVSID